MSERDGKFRNENTNSKTNKHLGRYWFEGMKNVSLNQLSKRKSSNNLEYEKYPVQNSKAVNITAKSKGLGTLKSIFSESK